MSPRGREVHGMSPNQQHRVRASCAMFVRARNRMSPSLMCNACNQPASCGAAHLQVPSVNTRRTTQRRRRISAGSRIVENPLRRTIGASITNGPQTGSSLLVCVCVFVCCCECFYVACGRRWQHRCPPCGNVREDARPVHSNVRVWQMCVCVCAWTTTAATATTSTSRYACGSIANVRAALMAGLDTFWRVDVHAVCAVRHMDDASGGSECGLEN